jgi:hypothetical protein
VTSRDDHARSVNGSVAAPPSLRRIDSIARA